MELNEIPEAFQTKLRLAIIASLITGKKTYKEIKQITGATDGNIGAQVAKLEQARYVVSIKEFIGKKPCTTYEISEMGRSIFIEYVNMLEKLVRGDSNQ